MKVRDACRRGCLILWLFSACASTPEPIQVFKPGPLLKQDQRSFREIERFYKKGKPEEVRVGAEKFLKTSPRSPLVAQVENFLGLAWMQLKNPNEASKHFERAIRTSQTPVSYYRLNLATAQLEEKNIAAARASIQQLEVYQLDIETQAKATLLDVRVLLEENQPLKACQTLLASTRLGSQKTPLWSLKRNWLERALQRVASVEELQSLRTQEESNPSVDSVFHELFVRLKRGEDPSQAQKVAQDLAQLLPESPYLADMGFQAPVEVSPSLPKPPPKVEDTSVAAVGVLLPLTGRFQPFGEHLLKGLLAGWESFGVTPASLPPLVFEDTGETPEKLLHAFNQLIHKHHVRLIFGPVLTRGMEQLLEQAEKLHVPLVSLARRRAPPSPWVLDMGMTPQAQVDTLAQFAVNELGAKRFAILSPTDKLGLEGAFQFWSAVEQHKGQVVGFETYASEETDFRQVIDLLSGLFFQDSRQKELQDLQKIREQKQIQRKTRATMKYFNLTPVVDFDAVFISDEGKTAAQIFPTFAYRDIDKIPFLGLSNWNTPDFPEQAASYGERVYFTDFKFDQDSHFVKHYIQHYTEPPTTLEALGYDAAALMAQLWRDHHPETREKWRDLFEGPFSVQGASGLVQLRSGTIYRNLTLHTVRKQTLTPL